MVAVLMVTLIIIVIEVLIFQLWVQVRMGTWQELRQCC